MKLTSAEIIKVLPDYEKFMEIAEEIESLSLEKVLLDSQIKTSEAELVKEMSVNPVYFQAGKIPSMAYIDATYKYTGLNGELPPMRLESARLGVHIERLKSDMDSYRILIGIWQTLSANERKATL